MIKKELLSKLRENIAPGEELTESTIAAMYEQRRSRRSCRGTRMAAAMTALVLVCAAVFTVYDAAAANSLRGLFNISEGNTISDGVIEAMDMPFKVISSESDSDLAQLEMCNVMYDGITVKLYFEATLSPELKNAAPFFDYYLQLPLESFSWHSETVEYDEVNNRYLIVISVMPKKENGGFPDEPVVLLANGLSWYERDGEESVYRSAEGSWRIEFTADCSTEPISAGLIECDGLTLSDICIGPMSMTFRTDMLFSLVRDDINEKEAITVIAYEKELCCGIGYGEYGGEYMYNLTFSEPIDPVGIEKVEFDGEKMVIYLLTK